MTLRDLGRVERKAAVLAVLGLLAGAGSAAARSGNSTSGTHSAPAFHSAPSARSAPAYRPAPASRAATGARSAPAYHPAFRPSENSIGPAAHGATSYGDGAHPSIYSPGSHVTYANTEHSPSVESTAPRGSSEHITRGGSAVRTRPNGGISDVHDAQRGMDIHNGLNGSRRVSVTRPDGGRVVAERGRPGYVQQEYGYHGRDFERRAYFYNGREYNRYYRGWGYHGVFLNVYAPGLFWGPRFYGWAYYPWGVPVAYGWGWGMSPWFGYYGYYFQPYPVYPSAAYWLTDYMIGEDLQQSYAAQDQAGEVDGAPAAADGAPLLTPEIKQEIADEVRNELALENQEATQSAQGEDVNPGSSGIARLLSDGQQHVFMAGEPLDLVDANGQECALSDGDVLLLKTPPPAGATAASLVVLASKGGQECKKFATVSVQLTDLQEMQNQMRERIDQGLQELHKKQGTGGLPAAPPSAQTPPVQPPYAAIAPPPNPQDAGDLQQQNQQADQTEKNAAGEAPAAVAQ